MTKSKTEIKIIEKAKRNHHGVVVIITGYRTNTKAPAYGHRELKAARKLIEKGILKFVETYNHVEYLSNGFNSEHSTEHVFELI